MQYFIVYRSLCERKKVLHAHSNRIREKEYKAGEKENCKYFINGIKWVSKFQRANPETKKQPQPKDEETNIMSAALTKRR